MIYFKISSHLQNDQDILNITIPLLKNGFYQLDFNQFQINPQTYKSNILTQINSTISLKEYNNFNYNAMIEFYKNKLSNYKLAIKNGYNKKIPEEISCDKELMKIYISNGGNYTFLSNYLK